MINLLPPKEEKELLLERNQKLAAIFGYVFAISLLCLSLVLFSLKFYMLSGLSLQKEILNEIEGKYQTEDFFSFKKVVQKYNAVLLAMDNFYKNETPLHILLEKIMKIQRPEGIDLTSVNVYRSGNDNLVKMSIGGTSDTRDSLLLYKSNIEATEGIQNIYFPPENWIKSRDIDFTVTFESMASGNPQ